MSSATDSPPSSPAANKARFGIAFKSWNRKLHFYAGLYFLFFTWLFALSGLILNHPGWSFPESWKNRKERSFERQLTIPGPEVKGDLAQAREIMRQLDIEGEILWTTTRTDPNQFVFQVRRPGDFFFLTADFTRKVVSVRHAHVNLWGVMKVLHVFTGVLNDPPNNRDWWLTYIWAFSMDAVAAGLIFMVLSSFYMWWELPQKRVPGAVALGVGTIICGVFCFALRWIF